MSTVEISLVDLIAFAATLLWTVWLTARSAGRSAGLVNGYVACLFLQHWFGALVHFVAPENFDENGLTNTGSHITTLAVVSFAGAAAFAQRKSIPRAGGPAPPSSPAQMTATGIKLIMAGIVFFAFLMPIITFVPGTAALTSSGVYLVVAGSCLWVAGIYFSNRRTAWLALLPPILLLPLVTILYMGFAGFGFNAAIIVVLCFLSRTKGVWRSAIVVGAMFVVGLNLYVNYIRDREEIRGSVWGGDPLSVRWTTLFDSAQNFELFDWTNPRHLNGIDARLNYNYLVGLAVENLEAGRVEYARGETLKLAVIGLVPRFLWAGKPAFGGSGGLVMHFTGFEVAEGTSVGIGHVMELYINFGLFGMVTGMAGLGLLLGWLDRRASDALDGRQPMTFVVWFLPGIALLQVIGSIAETIVTCVASAILVIALRNWFDRGHGSRAAPVPPALEASVRAM